MSHKCLINLFGRSSPFHTRIQTFCILSENHHIHKRLFNSISPAPSQSRMWEAFGQFYAQIRQEAQDDFQTLLGKEFLKAYEAYVQSSKESPR